MLTLNCLANKKTIIVFLFLVIVIPSGQNQKISCPYDGYIIGWDSTRCGCCQGWIIEINDQRFLADSIPNSDEIIGKSPEDSNYPIAVKLDFKKASHCNNKIVIKCINRKL